MVDCDDIWSLAAGDVPRVRPEFPMVSLDDPDVLCFMMRRNPFHDDADVDGDLAIRLVEIDTRRMELRSVFRYDMKMTALPTTAIPQPFFPVWSPSTSTFTLPVIRRQRQAKGGGINETSLKHRRNHYWNRHH